MHAFFNSFKAWLNSGKSQKKEKMKNNNCRL